MHVIHNNDRKRKESQSFTYRGIGFRSTFIPMLNLQKLTKGATMIFQTNRHTRLCNSLAIVVLLVSHISTQAQTMDNSNDYVGASYFSEGGFYPGFTLNFERSLLANKNFEMMAAARLGTYFHYRNNTGIFLTAQSGQRIRLYRSLYFEYYVGIGYLHTFLDGGDAYYVDATGSIHKKNNWGSPHLMPSVSFGLGYNTVIQHRPIRFFARPIIFWVIPFNRSSLVQYGLEVGALINLRKK